MPQPKSQDAASLEEFLHDVRWRATNALVTEFLAGEKTALEYRECSDPADVHEDVRELLQAFFEEIRERVEGPKAATVAADYLSWLSPEDNVSPVELPRFEEAKR